MSQFLIHSIKAGVFMTLFYLVYYLFLSRDTSYLRNRIYLVGSMLTSWLLPFVIFQIEYQFQTPVFGGAISNIDQVSTSVTGQGYLNPDAGFDLIAAFPVIYLSGMGIMLLRLLFAIARLLLLALNNPVREGVVRVRDGMISSGFSALGLTFINDSLPESEKEKIILHERIHSRFLHHIDTILCEVVIILQWLNPFAYLMRYSLRAVHEYQTDREFVNRTGSLREYQELIINQIFGTRSISIASCFSTTSLIKKRILMMTKKETRPGAMVKMAIALPLITGAIVLFSCKENSEIPTGTIPEETGVAAIEKAEPVKAADSSFTFTAQPAENPLTGSVTAGRPVEYGEMIIVVDGKETTSEFLAGIPDSEIAAFRTLRPETGLKIYGERAAAGVVYVTTKAYIASLKEKGDDVFMIVEKMPTFQNGDVQKFSQWVGANVRYPEEAHSKGIQGKVFIGFIVEPDGNVSNVTVLRSVDKTIDDEAVRIVMSSPKWTPGYQRGEPVRVRFSITVNFRLDNPDGK